MATALQVLAYAAGAGCLVAFVVAAMSALRMLRHRKPGVSRWTLATNGLWFYTGKGFTPAAEPDRRRFLRAVMAFVLALLVVIGSGLGAFMLTMDR